MEYKQFRVIVLVRWTQGDISIEFVCKRVIFEGEIGLEFALRLVSWFVVPIAIPGWTIEYVYQRITKRDWEFNVWSGSIYILVLVGFALVLAFSVSLTLRIFSIYILTALELLGLVSCIAVPLGNIGGYTDILLLLSKRRSVTGIPKLTFGMTSIWVALTSFFYTAFYFAVINFFTYNLNTSLYTGVEGQNNIELFIDFIYSSYVSIVTLGFTAISPNGIPSKLIYMVEVTLGLLFMLFIFSLFADRIISRHSEDI